MTSLHPVNRPTPFLVLSSCEDLWDLSHSLCFLGGRVQRYLRRPAWDSSTSFAEVLEPWADQRAVIAAAEYVQQLSDSWLPAVAHTLNAIHGIERSDRFWRILLANWLRDFLGALYDRFCRVSQALQLHPDAITITLSPESGVVPFDLLDFFELLKGDLYNHQLYSECLRKLGHEFPTRALAVRQPASVNNRPQMSVAGTIKQASLWASRRRWIRPRLVLRNTLAPAGFQARLSARTVGRIWPVPASSWRGQSQAIDYSARSQFEKALPAGSAFERVAAALIGTHLPQSLVEGFSVAERLSRQLYPVDVRAILSANGWYCDELFKHWAAESAERGCRLLGCQHGGDYGSVAAHSFERHERSITDKYFTWGWTDGAPGAAIVPAPALKLIGRGSEKLSSADSGILFVATHAIRYPCHLTPFERFFDNYIDWQRRFGAGLPEDLRRKMRVRLHAEDLGWDFAARWRKWNPEVRLEGWEVPFRESLRSCRIYVCDHLSTTFIEALAVNRPTVLFWNPETNPLRAAAEPYYRTLRDAGILFDSPERAAQTVTTAYADVAAWWYCRERQRARKVFCDRFGLQNSGALRVWAELLGQELRAP